MNKHISVQTTSFAPALGSEDETGVLHGRNPAYTMKKQGHEVN